MKSNISPSKVKALSVQLLAAAAGLVASATAMAQEASVTIPSAATYAKDAGGDGTAYAAILFGLAAVSVGIMVGVKWIKRARGAA